MRLAGRILMHGDQARHAAALGEDFANAMARRFRRCHAHIDARGRHDSLEMNIEAVREHQQRARLQVRRNFFGVQLRRRLIRNKDHHHISPFGGIGDRCHFKARLLRLGNRFRIRRQAHLHLHARVLEVESMRMPLRAIADDGHLLGLDQTRDRHLDRNKSSP